MCVLTQHREAVCACGNNHCGSEAGNCGVVDARFAFSRERGAAGTVSYVPTPEGRDAVIPLGRNTCFNPDCGWCHADSNRTLERCGKRISSALFYTETDHFTKTGSGHTQGKLEKERGFSYRTAWDTSQIYSIPGLYQTSSTSPLGGDLDGAGRSDMLVYYNGSPWAHGQTFGIVSWIVACANKPAQFCSLHCSGNHH